MKDLLVHSVVSVFVSDREAAQADDDPYKQAIRHVGRVLWLTTGELQGTPWLTSEFDGALQGSRLTGTATARLRRES